jgi:phosphoribosylformylglycinamidine (FGAM) synthase PurS component
MKLKRTRTHSIVKDYETVQRFLSDMGYDVSKLKLEQVVKIKLAIQDALEEINL